MAAFFLTPIAKSHAARTGRPVAVGMIAVALLREKTPAVSNIAPPRPMPYGRRDSGGSGAGADMRERAEAPAATIGENVRHWPRRTRIGALRVHRVSARTSHARRGDRDRLRLARKPDCNGRNSRTAYGVASATVSGAAGGGVGGGPASALVKIWGRRPSLADSGQGSSFGVDYIAQLAASYLAQSKCRQGAGGKVTSQDACMGQARMGESTWGR